MIRDSETVTADVAEFTRVTPTPGILVAYSKEGTVPVDQCLVTGKFVVGRSAECTLIIDDAKLSKRHFQFTCKDNICSIEDLGSRNGTFIDGQPLNGRVELKKVTLIRAGNNVFVFHVDATKYIKTPPKERHSMAGRFHTRSILNDLREAVLSGSNVLLSGPTGTGKELAVRAFSKMCDISDDSSIVPINAARIASHEEAASTLFGVAPRFFSNVDEREGLIEKADRGLLFIDEVHNLPDQTQRMLLRVLEDGMVAKLGQNTPKKISVRFVFASNSDAQTCCGLAPDIFARLRLVSIPSLIDRAADIPSIFNHIITQELLANDLDSVHPNEYLSADHYEALCLHGFPQTNIRGLIDLSKRFVSAILAGSDPKEALNRVFAEFFAGSPVAERQSMMRSKTENQKESLYERHKQLIIDTYNEREKNISATERHLKKLGLRCSRRWLVTFLKKWEVR